MTFTINMADMTEMADMTDMTDMIDMTDMAAMNDTADMTDMADMIDMTELRQFPVVSAGPSFCGALSDVTSGGRPVSSSTSASA